ncbi:hypothetical protein [Algoriphagus sp.]|uniref:hypothetical protein n=1 Tax=Algoriphagus sp. TaxID=1872435 RepID=UPI0025E0A32E|nr:hypothetical protein [Algoriphagus sp.]
MLGEPKFGRKKRREHTYLGFDILLLSQKRYNIISREPGNWLDTRKRVTGFGGGLRIGAVLGKFDVSTAYTFTGKQFRDFKNLNLAYRFLHIKL